MYNAGLILEGGGMRGAYTAGVLDFFLDNDIEFSRCYGVSAGAGHCCSYVSKQKKRAITVNVSYLENKEYASMHSLITTGDYFGAKFIYKKIPKVLNRFDHETFNSYKGKFYAVATNCITGEPEYLYVKDSRKDMAKVLASSSLPMLSRLIMIDGKPYLDGGVSDSVPLKQSEKDGNVKNIVVLTRNGGYRKKENKLIGIMKLKYKKYPKLIEAMKRRHIMYNDEMDYIEEQEKQGNIFVIRPTKAIEIDRLEKNKEKLLALYEEGYKDASACSEELMGYLNK